jgi:hypothetical protein
MSMKNNHCMRSVLWLFFRTGYPWSWENMILANAQNTLNDRTDLHYSRLEFIATLLWKSSHKCSTLHDVIIHTYFK